MPFSFRKSIRLGKNTKINLSKSGVGLSTGTKHAHISTGPRGTQVSGGAKGVRFQKQIGKAPKKRWWWPF